MLLTGDAIVLTGADLALRRGLHETGFVVAAAGFSVMFVAAVTHRAPAAAVVCIWLWWSSGGGGRARRAARALGAKSAAVISTLVQRIKPSPVPTPAAR